MIHRLLCASILLSATACDSGGQEATATAEIESRAPQTATTTGGDARVVGTIHATIDGEERIWYVLEGEVDGVRPSAPTGDYPGSTMTLVIVLPPEETSWTSPLPASTTPASSTCRALSTGRCS